VHVTGPVSTSTVNLPVAPKSAVLRTVSEPVLRSALELLTVVVAGTGSSSRKKSPSSGSSGNAGPFSMFVHSPSWKRWISSSSPVTFIRA